MIYIFFVILKRVVRVLFWWCFLCLVSDLIFQWRMNMWARAMLLVKALIQWWISISRLSSLSCTTSVLIKMYELFSVSLSFFLESSHLLAKSWNLYPVLSHKVITFISFYPSSLRKVCFQFFSLVFDIFDILAKTCRC